MAELTQIQDSSAIFIGWYGTCKNDICQDFPLTSTAIRAKIQKVFQTSSVPKNDGYASFDGTLDSSYDNSLQSFTKLECGKSYIIVLKPGVSSLIIDEFSFTDVSNATSGLVTDDCNVLPTPTPQSTPTPQATATPTPEPYNSECKCAPVGFSNVISIGDTFSSSGHSFSAFATGTEISYDSSSLVSSIASVVSLKFSNGSIAGLIVFSGSKPNNTKFYYKYGITCYTAVATESNKTEDDEWELELSVDKKLSNECGDDITPAEPVTPTPIQPTPTPTPIQPTPTPTPIQPTPTPTPIQPTPTPTPKPVKLFPPIISGATDIQTNSLSIGVSGIDNNAQLVKIDISLDENFSSILRTDTEVASQVAQTGTDFIPNLTADTFYYIRMYVTASNFLNSDYSPSYSVATLVERTPTPTPEQPTPTPEQPTPTPLQPTPTPEQPTPTPLQPTPTPLQPTPTPLQPTPTPLQPTPTPLQPTPTPEQLEDCCGGLVKIPTNGSMATIDGVTISAFEPGGEFCMSQLTETVEDLSVTILDPTGGTQFGGSITLSVRPVDTKVRYVSPNTEKCYEGDLSTLTNKLLILQEV